MIVKDYLTKYLCFFYYINDSAYLILREECRMSMGDILEVRIEKKEDYDFQYSSDS